MSREKPKSAMAALLDFSAVEGNAEITKDPKLTKPEIEKDLTKKRDIFIDETHTSDFTSEAPQKAIKEQLIVISPEECILWRFADRPSDELGDIDALARSLKEHGQQEPILVRKNQQKTSHLYEIVFGNRRWRAAQLAQIKLTAICKEVSDQQASLYQKEENENRKELSDYARAMSYRAQIDGGVFKSETELSKALGISKQALNDLMAYLRVPEKLREVISNYRSLSKNMVGKLAALSKNKDVFEVLLHLAPKISDKTITTSNLDHYIRKYLAPIAKKNASHKAVYEKRDSSGQIMYCTKPQANGDISVRLSRHAITQTEVDIEILHERFEKFLNNILNEEQ